MTGVESSVHSRQSLLDSIAGPEDLRSIPADELAGLAAQIRHQLVTRVRRTGGHLGPNLGVVELTIAVHRVFHSPRDAIVWDTGHQAYVHKMLTGRLGGFDTLRKAGGLSGYPSRAESDHDIIENSHASTALSYADGLAKAFALKGSIDRRVVAVVGDGAMTGGLCWEALNNIAAAPNRPVVIVLNDNGRSYEPTAGRLAVHLRALRERSAAGNVFENLGLAYVGPVDGHDIAALESALRAAAVLRLPAVVHCVTRKGAGDAAAERDDADHLHTVSASAPRPASPAGPAWTDVFGEELLAVATERPDVVAVTAAMLRPTGLLSMACRFPDRVFDVGIAEQHAVASATGLAAAGFHPVVAIYSTFLNRAFDQVLMDAALHRAPITFVLDRAGVTGPDGPSHHGMWDVPLFSLVPGVRAAAPRDADQLRELLRECMTHRDGPSMVRFPRGRSGPGIPATARWGNADLLTEHRAGAEVLLIAVGPLAGAAVEAARRLHEAGTEANVVDPRWVTPIDPVLVEAAAGHQLVVTVEDNAAAGGFGDAFGRALRATGADVDLLNLALPASFIPPGERQELLRAYGLDATGITHAVTTALTRPATTPRPGRRGELARHSS